MGNDDLDDDCEDRAGDDDLDEAERADAKDEEWRCIGADCCNPHYLHRRDECFTAEMAEAWHDEGRAAESAAAVAPDDDCTCAIVSVAAGGAEYCVAQDECKCRCPLHAPRPATAPAEGGPLVVALEPGRPRDAASAIRAMRGRRGMLPGLLAVTGAFGAGRALDESSMLVDPSEGRRRSRSPYYESAPRELSRYERANLEAARAKRARRNARAAELAARVSPRTAETKSQG